MAVSLRLFNYSPIHKRRCLFKEGKRRRKEEEKRGGSGEGRKGKRGGRGGEREEGRREKRGEEEIRKGRNGGERDGGKEAGKQEEKMRREGRAMGHMYKLDNADVGTYHFAFPMTSQKPGLGILQGPSLACLYSA